MTGRVDPSKADRALELHEKGLQPYQIAERLGITNRNIPAMIEKARKRREKREVAE
jgi:transcriptional regulator